MQRTIVGRRLALLLLLLPPALFAQTIPSPQPPPILVPAPAEPATTTPLPLPSPAAPFNPDPNGAFIGGGFGGPFSPFDPRLLAIFRASASTAWFPDEPVSGQSAKLGYLQEDLFVSVPVYHDGCDTVALTFRERNESFSTAAILPQSPTEQSRPFPDELWNIDFGAAYAHRFDDGWIGGGNVTVGSPSDKPFHGIDEMALGINAFLRIPSGEHNAWLFTLSYSPTAEVNFPIPMVSYLYNPSPDLRINIGLPFQIMYRPIPDLTLDFSYMLVRNVHARATYRICNWLRVHVGYDWSNESYFLADRQSVNDRLFYYDMRASGGFLFPITRNFAIDLVGGYVFNRFYFEGAQFADKNAGELDVGNGPYLAIQGRLRW
jgi:hypothetical protein